MVTKNTKDINKSSIKKVEAVLFAVGKEISSERIASLCDLSVDKTNSLIELLQQQYSNSKYSSLQIIKKDNGWKLTVLDEFIPLVSNLVSSTDLERPLMDTLAVVAWRYPVVQSEIIKLRSPAAYDHMAKLVEMGFIVKERFGRTYKVKLTKKFFAYFDLPSEESKQAFLKSVPQDILQEAEEVNKEIDETERLLEQEEKDSQNHNEIKKAIGQVLKD